MHLIWESLFILFYFCLFKSHWCNVNSTDISHMQYAHNLKKSDGKRMKIWPFNFGPLLSKILIWFCEWCKKIFIQKSSGWIGYYRKFLEGNPFNKTNYSNDLDYIHVKLPFLNSFVPFSTMHRVRGQRRNTWK